MNGLAMETLLDVDGERSTPKVLKREAAARVPVDQSALFEDDDLPELPVVECRESAEAGEAVPGGSEVVKSYQINRWCAAQVVRDRESGQYRYELIEPQLSMTERKKYDAIVAGLHKKTRAALEEMRRIGGRERIVRQFDRLCGEHGVDGEAKEKMAYCLDRDFRGYKKIHGLLADPNVEDVSCNGYHMPVYVYLPGFESLPANVRFGSEEELDDFVMYLVQKGGKSISAANPIQDVALPDGSRLNVTLYREVSSNGTTFSIRLANRAKGAAELLRHGTFSPEAMAFLWLAMENRCSMAFIGGTASGKTAALNAISSFIVEKNKVVTIEDTREVRLSSTNWTPLVVRESGDVPITEFDLLVAAFRQRPEYVIVGEVRTPEGAKAAIHGINSGHTVIMTFHADSPASFFNRITNEPFNISPNIAAGMSLCISMAMVTIPSGTTEIKVRRCRSICEVAGIADGRVRINTLFEWDPAGDAILMRPERSAILEKIRDDRGWSDGRLIAEIADRTTVLRWLASHMICDEAELGRVIECFYRNRKELIEKVRARKGHDPGGMAAHEAS